MKVDFMHFLAFGFFLFLWKALLLVANIEFRRNNIHVPAAVAGLLS
jgi:hypothetical protein